MGGRRYKSTNYFSPFDSNTVCDRTGFRTKKSNVQKTWEGFHVLPESWEPRQPQDFPVIPVTQQVYKNVRIEGVQAEGAFPPPDPI